MTTVFLLKSGRYSDIKVEGVFSTKEKAEAALLELQKITGDKAGPIEEMEVDELCRHHAKPHWRSNIDLMTGKISEDTRWCNYGQVHVWDHKADWMDADKAEPHVDEYPYAGGYIPKEIVVYSSVSQDHANKLAVEARQYLMGKLDFSLIVEKHGGLFYPEHLTAILRGEVNPFRD